MRIETYLIPRELDGVEIGWGNGYIGLPKGHPWFEKPYDDLDVSVHGGLTWSNNHKPQHDPDGLWWIGFDTAHSGDNKNNCCEGYVRQEVTRLLVQALQATLE